MKKIYENKIKTIYILVFLFPLLNLIKYIRAIPLLETKNAFSFWNFILHCSYSEYLLMLSPIVISLILVEYLEPIINGAVFKNEVLRKGYFKTIKDNYLKSAIKCIIPFAIIYILTFIIGHIFLPKTIEITKYHDVMSSFYYEGVNSPYIFVLLNCVSTLFYILTVINISLILFKFFRKKIHTVVGTFVSINMLNFILYYSLSFISGIVGSESFSSYAHLANIYEGYIVQSTITTSLFNSIIYFLLTLPPLLILYLKKDWMGYE